MKYYLYVDNFRGFADTCIPVADVNFLVGENSTGKSSLLSLLKLFSGPAFLMGHGLADEDVGFSHFSDMVSIHSDDQKYFRVGLVSELMEKGDEGAGKGVTAGTLFTFRERQGQPILVKCTFCRGQEQLTLRFGSNVYYKAKKHKAPLTLESLVQTMRSDWVIEHSGKDRGYSRLDAPSNIGSRIPVLVALSLLGDTSGQEARKGQLLRYPPEIGLAFPDLTWFGPIRTKPKRTYDELSLQFSPEGQHTPYLIRRMLRSRSQAARLKQFIEKVGTASGLFQDVRIRSFGRGATERFELDIVLDGKALNILNVGYGVSQSLPIIVELLARAPQTWFAIQEPEIHLHPRAQAAVGDVLFEMAVTDQKRFLVETHSDFTIDRFRMNYRRKRAGKPEGQILFFERRDKRNVITPLQIGESGELPANQPESYRQFFIREQMNLLGI